jgi:transposase-like protein
MSDETNQLSPKQQTGIEALLTTQTIGEAAKKAGVSPATMHRWLKTDIFKDAYRSSKAEVVYHSITQLQIATTKAAQQLIEISKNKAVSAQTQVTACKAILDYGLKAIDKEIIIARLEALETAVARNSKRKTPF